MIRRILTSIVAVAPVAFVLSATMPLSSFAGFFGDHPRYLHALSDLRYARALIERPDAPNVMADEQNAIRELDKSIGEIKQAARDDWKLLGDHPPVDTKMNHHDRLYEALKVMDRAHHDIDKEEDDRAARGLRNRALGHLDQARNYVKLAIGDKKMDQRF
jgi:hypothetical protein